MTFIFKTYQTFTLSSTPQQVVNESCEICGWTIINPNSTTVYVKLFDSLSPTIGVSIPTAILPIPPGNGSSPGIYTKEDNEVYRDFCTALSIAAVTGLATNSSDTPASPLYCEMVVDY